MPLMFLNYPEGTFTPQNLNKLADQMTRDGEELEGFAEKSVATGSSSEPPMNGRSISVNSDARPGKSKRAMAQEAARPNTVLRGTTTSAVIRVRRRAAAVSGSAKLAR